jgi:hypothetical protein
MHIILEPAEVTASEISLELYPKVEHRFESYKEAK